MFKRLCVATVMAAAFFGTSPAMAQDLKVGVSGMPPGQGNPYTGIGTPSSFVWDAIFDPMVRIDGSGKAIPALAESWKNVDPTHWEFTLRQGVSFSNGEPFNADAVVAALTFLIKEGRPTPVGGELRNLVSATKKDDKTVVIETSGPDPVLPNKLAMVSIVAPGAWAKLGPAEFAKAPVGTGPFTLDKWTPSAAQLSANKTSWRPAKIGTMEILALPERASRLQALLSGQINIGFGFSPDNVGQIKSGGMQSLVTPAPQVMSLAFANVQHANSPFNDVRVRQAANLAVNRKAIADVLLAGLGAPAGQAGTAAAFGYDPKIPPYPTDVEKAKKLMADAGFAKGFSATAQVVVGSFPADSEIYQQAAIDLKAIGITLELKQITFPEWLDFYLKGTWPHEMFGSSWNTAPYMDTIRPYTYTSCMKPSPFFCDKETMPLIEATTAEFKPEARAELLRKLHAKTSEVLPAIWLVEQIDLSAVSPKVTGLVFENRVVHYEGVTVAK